MPKPPISTVTNITSRLPPVPRNLTIFSLIQPSNHFHVGNYLGTIKIWRDFANNKEVLKSDPTILFGLADLHALTTPRDPVKFKAARLEAVATIIASGVDPKNAIIFAQSAIPEHSELYWLLCCLTGMGYLNRMTQWKAKSLAASESSVFDPEIMKKTYAGVFMYPVLQAADILLYKSTLVPVGDDQSQHLELCRHIAELFNKTYKGFQFPLPRTVLAPTKKILSLRDTSKKMSKSDPDPLGCLFLTDDEKTISKKIRKAVTDSVGAPFTFDPVTRPGVANLLTMVSGVRDVPIETVQKEVENFKDHKELKDYVTEALIEGLRPCRQRYQELVEDQAYLEKILHSGNQRAREIAMKNMAEIKKAHGL